jgi:hypothetical protein
VNGDNVAVGNRTSSGGKVCVGGNVAVGNIVGVEVGCGEIVVMLLAVWVNLATVEIPSAGISFPFDDMELA